MSEVRNVLTAWPDLKAVADECRVSKGAVEQWIKRGVIPPRHLLTLAKSAKRNGYKHINVEYLATFSQPPQQG
jgi:hypothetical protein